MKFGDKATMNDKYYVGDENKGKVWTVRSEPWNLCGTEVVLLEGKSGCYAIDGLTKIECNSCKFYPCGHYACGLEAWECDSYKPAD